MNKKTETITGDRLDEFQNVSYTKLLLDPFLYQVMQNKDNLAVIDEFQQVTYKELFYRAYSIAEHIRSCGYEKGSCIAVLMDKTADLLSAIFGILLADCIYVPINPQNPQNRISEILSLCESACVLTCQKNNPVAIQYDIPVFDCGQQIFDCDWNEKDFQEALTKCKNRSRAKNDLAYIIFTSGTTGKSKGVCVTSENLYFFVQGILQTSYELPGKENKRVALVAPPFFDASIQQIFPCILTGRTLYLVPERFKKDGEALSKFFSEHRIQHTDMTPSLFLIWINNSQFSSLSYSLETIIIGGEKLNCSSLHDFFRRYPNKLPILQNAYGPTECCVDTTIYTVRPEILAVSGSVPIGTALPHNKIYLLNEQMEPVEDGTIAELYIGGKSVGNGYWKDPVSTKERFLDSPFHAHEILYKTGDMVKKTTEGDVLFVCRNDKQVKLRGYRIELYEIENILQDLPHIQKALARLVEDDQEDYLAAYVVVNELDAVEPVKIRSELTKYLPGYMIPRFIIPIQSFPTTANGKLDVERLPNPKQYLYTESVLSNSYSKIDEEISQVFKSVLNIQQIDCYESFFEMGGHSLNAIRLMSRLNDKFSVQIRLKDIFDHPSVYELARFMEKQPAVETQNNRQDKVLGTPNNYPQSMMQQRIYISEIVEGSNRANHISEAMDIYGALDYSRFKWALQQLTIRHESLRTAFYRQNDQLLQKVLPAGAISLDVKMIEEKLELEKLLETINVPYDLTQPPLFRIRFLPVSDKHCLVLFNIHHIIFDALSMPVFLRDLIRLYQGQSMEPLACQYKDYAYQQSQCLGHIGKNKLRDYWIQTLTGNLEPLQLPVDFPYKSRSHEGAVIQCEIKEKLLCHCYHQIKLADCTPFVLFLSAFAILLYKLTQQTTIVVGTMTTGRDKSELEELIGVFVNTVPLVVHINPEMSIGNLMQHVKEVTVSAINNQEYPFMDMVRDMNYKRQPGRNPIFDVSFNYISNLQEANEFDDIRIHFRNHQIYETVGDLHIQMTETGSSIFIQLFYSTNLFKESTIADIKEKYFRILEQLEVSTSIKDIVTRDAAISENIENRLGRKL